MDSKKVSDIMKFFTDMDAFWGHDDDQIAGIREEFENAENNKEVLHVADNHDIFPDDDEVRGWFIELIEN